MNKEAEGKPICDVIAGYLQEVKTVRIAHLNIPKIKKVKDNPGIADELS